MNNRAYEDLEQWEQAFYDLNMKLGNEVWGARLEGDGATGSRMRVFINSAEWEEKVLQETNGVLAGHPLVFTVYSQEEHSRKLQEKEILEKEEEYVEATTTST